MNDTHQNLTVLLLAAIGVAIAARRLRLPYTVGLVVAGVLLALGHLPAGGLLTHDLIFDIILPPLLFEAALSLHWRHLRQDLAPILMLAVLGVLISAATVAFGMVRLLGWPVPSAVLFGVLIAATDPVAVIALFKDLGLQGRLRWLVESESLFNDGVAAVLFSLALAWASTGNAPTPQAALASFALNAGGGIVLGLAVGAAAITIAGRTADAMVETALTLLAAYGAFQAAEHLHLSGVLATVAAGMVMGNAGLLRPEDTSSLSTAGRRAVEGFWEFAAFLANSLVFLLIGLAVAAQGFTGLRPAAQGFIILLVLLSRALTVYALCGLFARTKLAVPWGQQHVLWWGGLRGALGLALALALPPDLPFRAEILRATFTVVVFSVVVQGLTMRPLLRAVGQLPH